jgi:hypothetical protein
MVYFQTKNPALGKFRRALECKRLLYSVAIRNIFDGHLIYIIDTYLVIWWPFGIFSSLFGILCQGQSGNPGTKSSQSSPLNGQSAKEMRLRTERPVNKEINKHSRYSSKKCLFVAHTYLKVRSLS